MKYGGLKQASEKVFSIPVPVNGINSSVSADVIEDTQVAFAKNMVPFEDALKTRKGLCGSVDSVLDAPEFKLARGYSYRLTDTGGYINGEYKQIAVADIDFDDSAFFYCVYLLGADATVKSIGKIWFSRVDDTTFYKPENIIFYFGKPQKGGGIFALVTLKNKNNSAQTEHRIYEVNASLSDWEFCYEYYTPTVYINGRGNRYEYASEFNQVYSAKPVVAEPLNMLDGRFYAYYTSDGYSNSFRLPFSDIAESSVIIRVYYNLESYAEWLIYAEERSSSAEPFLGKDVTANVDREKGTVYFTADNAEYSIPIMNMYSENNIRILAKKELPQGFEEVVSAKLSLTAEGKIFLTGSAEGNKIYTADYDNPLYFPQSYNNSVGDSASPVTALGFKEQKLLIFKEDEIYTAKLKRGTAINKTALLADNGAVFKETDSFDIELISKGIGCPKNAQVTFIGNKPIWRGKDGEVYTLSGNEAVILSKQVSAFLKAKVSGEKLASAVGGNNFFLFKGRNIIIMDYKDQKSVWYFWELPESTEVLGAVSNQKEIAFLCKGKAQSYCYTAVLQGDCDVTVESTVNGYKTVKNAIESEIKTKSFKLGTVGRKKRINSAVLRLDTAKNLKIRLGDGFAFLDFDSDTAQSLDAQRGLRLITDIYGVYEFYISLKSNSGISFKGADIYFTEIGK